MIESQIQLAYNYAFQGAQVPYMTPVISRVDYSGKHRFSRLPKVLLCLGLASLIIYFTPIVLNSAIGGSSELELNAESMRILASLKEGKVDNYLPPLDSSLPVGSYLSIPKIGVKSAINEQPQESFEEALKKGPWRAPDYSTPDKQGVPTILTAHRFGYLVWSNKFRHENSFFNLPKLKIGDTAEVVWGQRKYVYAVYAESQGEEITDYSADLILYTCLDLSSSMRIFKYAKLIRA